MAKDNMEQEKVPMSSEEEFSVRRLVSNIGIVANGKGKRIGEVESAVGVSQGYLARAANQNKCPSIKIVWQIAKFLRVNTSTLVDTDLEHSSDDAKMMADFVLKLDAQTRDGDISWVSHGGKHSPPHERYERMELVSKSEDGYCYENHSEITPYPFILSDDIFVYDGAEEDTALAIISYKLPDEDYGGFDYLFIWQEGEAYKWEPLFYTHNDLSGFVAQMTYKLLDSIREQRDNQIMTPRGRKFISNFLK